MKDGDLYKMWYGGYDSSNVSRILYSESKDLKNWSTPIMVMNKGVISLASQSVAHPYVIKDNGIYKMWFVGHDGTNWRVLNSTSVDGKVWDTPTLNINITKSSYCSQQIMKPCVIKDGSVYKIWFYGSDGTTKRLLYAESSDGIAWGTPIIVLEKNASAGYPTMAYEECKVIKISDTLYKLYFIAMDTNGYANLYVSTSSDGKVWSPGVVTVKRNSATDWPHISVIKDNENYKAILCADNNKFNYVQSDDGINWVKQSLSGTVVENLKVNKQVNLDLDNNIKVESKETALRYLFKNGDKVRFDCNGKINSFEASNVVKLKVECFGASGGTYSSYIGGKGGYTYGLLDTSKTKRFFVVPGGKGCAYGAVS